MSNSTVLSQNLRDMLKSLQLSSAGFKDTGSGGIVWCRRCGLEVSKWALGANAFDFHREKAPHCPFIQSKTSSRSSDKQLVVEKENDVGDNSKGSKLQNSPEHEKIKGYQIDPSLNTLFEVESLLQVRRRGFSLWPHRLPSSAQMIEAGFSKCNVGDRVICLYCNLICQQWTSSTDDPCEVHKTLSPNCVYVKAKLICPPTSSILIVNENGASATANSPSSSSSNLEPSRSHEIVFTAPCNPAFAELPKRHATFATWPQENLPPIDGLVRAGFFYTGTNTIVTCFHCNGSLQNWGPKDNPMIEHARCFPHCAYAKQLCGDEMYRKIQESKRAKQERMRANETNAVGATNNNRPVTTGRQLIAPDESTLSRLVAARLDLPISQRLLDKNFKLSIIKRCWEDQLRLKQHDFVSEIDLHIACVILQKQIEHINGKKENIVIPSIRMKQIREQSEIGEHRTSGQLNDFTCRRTSMLSAASRSNTLLDTRTIQDVQRRTFAHRTYVKKKLAHSPAKPIPVINESAIPQTSSNYSSTRDIPNLSQFDQIVYPTSKNSRYYQLTKRLASFAAWPTTNLPTADDLARAGFFYTGRETIVQCFYCHGVLRNWGLNDVPIAEHVRWFPYCAYAKQACGDEMYQQIQKTQRERQNNDGTDGTEEEAQTHCPQLSIPDEVTLATLVENRLNLPISKYLLDKYFNISVIKRCWEEQLRLKKHDFHSDDDLFVAWVIIQKQIEHINSNDDNIVVSNVRVQRIQHQ